MWYVENFCQGSKQALSYGCAKNITRCRWYWVCTWVVWLPPTPPCRSPATATPFRSYSTAMESMHRSYDRVMLRTPVWPPSSQGLPPVPPHGPTFMIFLDTTIFFWGCCSCRKNQKKGISCIIEVYELLTELLDRKIQMIFLFCKTENEVHDLHTMFGSDMLRTTPSSKVSS